MAREVYVSRSNRLLSHVERVFGQHTLVVIGRSRVRMNSIHKRYIKCVHCCCRCKRFPGSVTCCIGGTHTPTSTAAPPSTPRPTPHSTPQPTPRATARPTPRRTAATRPPSPRHTAAHASTSTAVHSVASRSSVHIYTPPHVPTSSTQHTPSSSTHPIVHTSTAASPSHTPAAGKRALFREPLVIVIACAVGGVLLLTCLAALVVCLCVARQRRKRRLQARTMLRKRRANTRPKQFTVV